MIGSSHRRRAKSPLGTVLIINLLRKGLTPRAWAFCVPFLSLSRVQMWIKSSAIVPAPVSHKLLLGLKLLNVALFTNILVLCNDVASNPGPIDVTQSDLSSLEGSFSSPAEYSPSTTGTRRGSRINTDRFPEQALRTQGSRGIREHASQKISWVSARGRFLLYISHIWGMCRPIG